MDEIDWKKVKRGDKLTLTVEVDDDSPHSGAGVIVRLTNGICFVVVPRDSATSWTPAPRPISEGDEVLYRDHSTIYEVAGVLGDFVWIRAQNTDLPGFATYKRFLQHRN